MAVWAVVMGWSYQDSLGWWCAPVYEQARSGFDAIKARAQLLGVYAGGNEGKGGLVIRLINGSRIEFRSWEREENLSSRTVHWMVIDEAHLLTLRAKAIMDARRSSTLGPVRIIGNSSGDASEFARVCDLARDPANAESMGFYHWTWREKFEALGGFTTEYGQAYARFISEQRRNLPDWLFRATYEAASIPDEDAAIPADIIARASNLEPRDAPLPGVPYVIAWDVAQSMDFNVALPIPLAGPRHVTAMKRFHRLDYVAVAHEFAGYGRVWNNARHVIETNGPGKPVLDHMQAMDGVDAVGWFTENANKHAAFLDLVRDLSAGARGDDGGLHLAPLPPLQAELKSIRYRRREGGTYSYSAPDGQHDDTFMSLLIGNRSAVRAAMPLVA